MVSEGMTNKAIADRLCVSVRTVEGHIYRACTKLNVADRTLLAEVVASSKTSSGLRKTSPRSPSKL
jgi:DNA-binding NarL/FixJ family response regulator